MSTVDTAVAKVVELLEGPGWETGTKQRIWNQKARVLLTSAQDPDWLCLEVNGVPISLTWRHRRKLAKAARALEARRQEDALRSFVGPLPTAPGRWPSPPASEVEP